MERLAGQLHYMIGRYSTDTPSLLRRTVASRHLPGLADPKARQNPPSYMSRTPTSTLRFESSLAPTQRFLIPERTRRDIIDSVEAWLAGLPDQKAAMFHLSEKYASVPATPNNSPPRSLRGSKLGSWTVTPRKVAFFASALISLMVLNAVLSTCHHRRSLRPAYLTRKIPYNATVLPNAAFQPPEALPHRGSDIIDTFTSYKYRSTCNVSSLDLHAPFAPLCQDRTSMLTAMSSGGRIGHDAPYMPRGCDMRWFSTEEVCETLSRFEKVIFIGDSMMRHVIGSINVLIREDLGYGAVTDWNFSPEERKECFCNYQFNVKACSVQGIFKTADVVKNDPGSVACPANTIDVMIEQMIRFPIAPEELARFRALLGTTKPAKPYAFIFGHGLWNDLDLQATLDWLDLILETTASQLHYLGARKDAFWPRLFVTPNAAGKEKPDEWIVSQGNKALMIFEEAVAVKMGRRGVEHLGTWNMSIQGNKFDGVHVDLKGNLIKAMMVMNWLNMLEVESH